MADTTLRANCYRCGRFVGKDGDMDLHSLAIDDGWEPECGRCIRARAATTTQETKP